MRFLSAVCAVAALSLVATGCGAPTPRVLESTVSDAFVPTRPTHTIAGRNVNVRNQRMEIIGEARRGEPVAITGREMPGVEGLIFAEVYFFEAPQGYGWVAKRYLAPIAQDPVPAAEIIWDHESLVVAGDGCEPRDVEAVPNGSVLSYLFSGLSLQLSGTGEVRAHCTLKMFATIPREAYGALASLDADWGIVKSTGTAVAIDIRSRWNFHTPRGPLTLELPRIFEVGREGREVNEPFGSSRVENSTRSVMRSLCGYPHVGAVLEVDVSLWGKSRAGHNLILNMDGINANWEPEFACP